MEYNVTLNLLQYVLVLSTFGTLGSSYEAYKIAGSIRPFLARIITGSFSGSITMLIVYKLGMENDPLILHWGVAAILGYFLEKKDENNVIEKLILAFKGAK